MIRRALIVCAVLLATGATPDVFRHRPSGLAFGTNLSGGRSNSANGVTGTLAGGAEIVSGYGGFAGSGFTGPGASTTDTYPKLDADGTLALIPNLSDITVEAWIYVTTLARFGGIFSANDIDNSSGGNYFLIRTDNNNKIQVIATGATGTAIYSGASTSAVSINTWYHIAFSGTSYGGKLYINGAQESLTYGSGSSSTDARWEAGATSGARDDLRFGGFFYRVNTGNNYYNQSFTGRIDLPLVFTYAKTAAQIAQDYNTGAAHIAGGGTP